MTCFLFFSQVLVILWSLDQRSLALLFTIFGHSRKTRLVISSLVKRLKLVKVLTLCQAPPLYFRYITGKKTPIFLPIILEIASLSHWFRSRPWLSYHPGVLSLLDWLLLHLSKDLIYLKPNSFNKFYLCLSSENSGGVFSLSGFSFTWHSRFTG